MVVYQEWLAILQISKKLILELNFQSENVARLVKFTSDIGSGFGKTPPLKGGRVKIT